MIYAFYFFALLVSSQAFAKTIENEADLLFEKLSSASAEQYESVSESMSETGLKNAAISYGFQGGKYVTLKAILEHLDKRFADAPFVDFRPVMMMKEGFLLLPAKITIQKGREVITESAARRAAYIPNIVKQPKFVSVMPSWRDYFRIELTPPSINRHSVLPQNPKEQAIWKRKVREGWEKGVENAYDQYERRLARLKDDYNGYLMYHILRDNNMVTEPQFSSNFYAVTGGGSTMSIDEVIVEVKVNPKLISNRDAWESIPRLPSFLDFAKD